MIIKNRSDTMNESIDNFIIGLGKLMGTTDKSEISEILSGEKDVTEDMNDIQKTVASLCKLIKTISKTSSKITDSLCQNNDKDKNFRGQQGLPGRQGIIGEKGEKGEKGESHFELEKNIITPKHLIALNANNSDSYMFEWDDKNLRNEDRFGRIVYLTSCGTIKLVEHIEEFELKNQIGVIGYSQLIHNSHSHEWCHKYLKDDLERDIIKRKYIWKNKKGVIVESLRKPAKNINYEVTTGKIINPDYNENRQYDNRMDRKEWANVILKGYVPIIIKSLDEIDDKWVITTMINETKNIRKVLLR